MIELGFRNWLLRILTNVDLKKIFVRNGWERRWPGGKKGAGGAAVRALASHHYGPEFDSRTRLHMWVEFVGSLLCFEGFSPGSPVFLPPQKPTLIRSRLCSVARHESYGGSQRRPCMPSTRPRWAASPAIQPLGCEWGWLANPNLFIWEQYFPFSVLCFILSRIRFFWFNCIHIHVLFMCNR